MDELIQEIRTVYALISSISVANDAIDVSAAARAKLRRVETALVEMCKKETEETVD